MQEAKEDQEEQLVYVGTPTLSEIKKYFKEQQRLVNIKNLEVTPEAPANQEDKLSDSFLLYLKTRQQKLAEAKRDMSYPSPLSSKCQESGSRNLNDTTVIEPSNVSWDITDESFMAQEKICSDVSIPLIDLNGTSFSVSDSSDENNVIMKIVNNHAETPGNKFPINMTKLDMTLLGEIEEPSFMQQHQSLFQNSPIKQSPFGKNRPSTIAEEESINSGKNVSLDVSFQSLDPFTRPQSSGSDTFNTANDESISAKSTGFFQNVRPTGKSFYSDFDNSTLNCERSFERDSLSMRNTRASRVQDMTKDSLDPSIDHSTIEISSASENSLMNEYDKYPTKTEIKLDNSSLMDESTEMETENAGRKFNDTLEEFEFMMEQGKKMAEENKRIKTPEIRTAKTPNTVIKKDIVSLLTCKNILPKSLTKVMGGHEKSPLALKKPTTPNSFKHPQMMSSKIPQPASLKSNKLFSSNPQFSHIVSPIGRYIKNTPAIPLKKAVKLNYYDGGISKLYNSRDSDVSFKENYDETNSAEALVALPRRGKIGTIKKQVYDQRNPIKTSAGVGGEEMTRLLANSSPIVTSHEGRIKFKNLGHNESQINDESFADLSLMSSDVSLQAGDVSVQVINDAKRC